MRRNVPWLLLGLALVSGARGDDAATRDKPILVLDAGGHTAAIRKVLFTPDGREVVTVSDDKTIRIWDVATGEPLRVLRPPIGPGPEGMLFAAALSPNSLTLAVGGYGLKPFRSVEIHLIDLATGRIARALYGHTRAIESLAFAPDGKRLASGSQDRTARIWDPANGQCKYVFKGHIDTVGDVTFSPDGRRLLTSSPDRTGRIWSVETGVMEAELKGHANRLLCGDWSADGRMIATGSADQTIRLWDSDGRYLRSIDGLENHVTSLAFTADSRALLATRGGGSRGSPVSSILLDVGTGKERVRFARNRSTVLSGALSSDGSLAATSGGNQNETYIWKTVDASLTQRLSGESKVVWNAGWTSDGNAIAWGNRVRFQSHNDMGPIEQTFRVSELELAAVRDETFVRARPARGAITLNRVDETSVAIDRNGRTAATIKLARNERVNGFTLLGEDRVAVCANFGLYLFDAHSGRKVRRFIGHTAPVWAVAPSPDGRFLLSCSGDQTVRVWAPDRDEPLLSLFVAGDDWVAWTPQGYYAASPDGEKLMGLHVGNGRDKLASFYPVALFRTALCRPDVIKLILTTGGAERALEVADQARGIATKPINVTNLLPPTVEVTAPRHGTTVDSSKLEVRATAQSRGDRPITAMRLLIDGRPYRGQGGVKTIEQAKLGEIREVWSIELEPGEHAIAIQAQSAASRCTSDPVDVIYKSPEPARLPALHVLAVGITEYPGDRKLRYASKDAQAIERVFREKTGPLYRTVEVKLLTDAGATRTEFLNGLTWIRKRMTQRDVGVVFFSGHAQRDRGGSLYLLPVDADPENLLTTGVDADQLKKVVAAMPGRVLALLDASHAGAVDGDEQMNPNGLTDDLVRALATDDYGAIAMASSTGREFSLDNNAERQGNFTLAIVEGLSGKADSNKDGLVYVNELNTYVRDRVQGLTKGQQHPATAKPASVRSFPVSKP